jgi:rubrerythrin
MTGNDIKAEVMKTFERFNEGYQKRNSDELDTFMEIFIDAEDTEMMGISATKPGAFEWFTGTGEIREIIESDWKYWGDVEFDLKNMRVHHHQDVAWFSLSASMKQIAGDEETWEFYLDKMKELLDEKGSKAHDRIFEAAHFGIRRVRERNLGAGYRYPMVVTGTLIKQDIWKIHSLHWSMPVD